VLRNGGVGSLDGSEVIGCSRGAAACSGSVLLEPSGEYDSGQLRARGGAMIWDGSESEGNLRKAVLVYSTDSIVRYRLL
jgi:hypothetical protein